MAAAALVWFKRPLLSSSKPISTVLDQRKQALTDVRRSGVDHSDYPPPAPIAEFSRSTLSSRHATQSLRAQQSFSRLELLVWKYGLGGFGESIDGGVRSESKKPPQKGRFFTALTGFRVMEAVYCLSKSLAMNSDTENRRTIHSPLSTVRETPLLCHLFSVYGTLRAPSRRMIKAHASRTELSQSKVS